MRIDRENILSQHASFWIQHQLVVHPLGLDPARFCDRVTQPSNDHRLETDS